MMTLSLLILIFYIFWGIISVFAQAENSHLAEKIKAYDLLNIVPDYKFFCPKPSRYDYHLYYRVPATDDARDEWNEIQVEHRNALICFIWNPSKRDRKIFSKIIKVIRQKHKKAGSRHYGAMYLSLISHIRQKASVPEDLPIQFRITYTQNLNESAEEKEFYLSPLHRTLS